jgi:hypothetical protein
MTAKKPSAARQMTTRSVTLIRCIANKILLVSKISKGIPLLQLLRNRHRLLSLTDPKPLIPQLRKNAGNCTAATKKTARKGGLFCRALTMIGLEKSGSGSLVAAAAPRNQASESHQQARNPCADDRSGDRACDRRREGGVPEID